ncbi:MAG: radical SAM protein [Acidobacteria bacterium]|nr:radical SAM protein [Acidobacteriota bacterium]
MSENRLDLQKGIIYGPVKSRRLGNSVGINISPQEIKMCTLNCLYCQYSWTGLLVKDGEPFRQILPSKKEVEDALKNFFSRANEFEEEIDSLTFSGNGEPTLHPDFPEIADMVIETSKKIKSKPKTACLSNSTTLSKNDVFKALLKIDEPIMKLDAGNKKMFELLNRPAGKVDFDEMVFKLSNFKGNLTIQTLFVEGEVDNTQEEEVESYLEKLKIIKPKVVQIYSLDRPPAFKKIRKVSLEKLNKIKIRIVRELNSNVVVY